MMVRLGTRLDQHRPTKNLMIPTLEEISEKNNNKQYLQFLIKKKDFGIILY